MIPNQYGNEVEDNFYKRRGFQPPQRFPHLTEEEIRKRLAENGHKCKWRQKGNEIFCDEDPSGMRHGHVIGPKRRLAGTTKTGEPVLVPVGPVARKQVK